MSIKSNTMDNSKRGSYTHREPFRKKKLHDYSHTKAHRSLVDNITSDSEINIQNYLNMT
jgi:hypothetical protein